MDVRVCSLPPPKNTVQNHLLFSLTPPPFRVDVTFVWSPIRAYIEVKKSPHSLKTASFLENRPNWGSTFIQVEIVSSYIVYKSPKI